MVSTGSYIVETDWDIRYNNAPINLDLLALIYRARAFNTQLGKEENSPFFKLQVTGDSNVEIVPTIIVKPQDTQIIKDQDVTYINCIANAR